MFTSLFSRTLLITAFCLSSLVQQMHAVATEQAPTEQELVQHVGVYKFSLPTYLFTLTCMQFQLLSSSLLASLTAAKIAPSNMTLTPKRLACLCFLSILSLTAGAAQSAKTTSETHPESSLSEKFCKTIKDAFPSACINYVINTIALTLMGLSIL